MDLWYAAFDPEGGVAPLAAYESWMSPEERARRDRLRLERDRVAFLAARALVRTVLSGYAPVEPADWRFTPPPGKPRVAHPPTATPLHFSLAHTPGLVACVVSAAHERIGVDVERADRAVETLSGAGRGREFLADWTLKESYAKARGLGLELPFDGIAFRIEGDDIRVTFAAEVEDDPAPWRFALLETPTGHLVAVAADTGGAALALRVTPVAL